MRQKIVLALIVLLLFGLGLLGQYQLSPANLTENLSTSSYQVLMLFLLDGEWTFEYTELPLAVEFVRFTAPLVAVASLVLVIAGNARIAISHFFVRFRKEHTIVVGLGDKSWQFLESCIERRRFVVLERDPGNLMIQRARNLGFNVINRDLNDADIYQAIGLAQAANIVFFSNNDGANIETAVKVRNYLKTIDHHNTQLQMHIHLNQIGLARQLENHPRFFADQSKIPISFFSQHDLCARMLLRDYPPEIYADAANQPQVHLAIYGFDRLGEKLLTESASLCHFSNASSLKITVFDEDPEFRHKQFIANHPHSTELLCLEFLEHKAEALLPFQDNPDFCLSTVTQHILCHATDEENLSLALRLRSTLLQEVSSNAPILVRMQHSSGLSQLLESGSGGPEIPDGIFPFGTLDQVLHVDNILSTQLDSLARAMHEIYIEEQVNNGKIHRAQARMWSDLTQWERKQNLFKADHWPVRLRALRCVADSRSQTVFELSEEQAHVQAIMEHNRYLHQKLSDGWRYGPERSQEARTNPFLLPWAELPEDQQTLEINDAMAQPQYFAQKLGQSIKQRVVIGVTGHRLNKLDVNSTPLKAAITATLQNIASAHPDAAFTVMSPLAEGADRLVATLAMELLNAELQAPLPLPYELYATDFTSPDSLEEFHELVGQANWYFEMPMRFGNLQSLASTSSGSNEQRNKQYALVGAYVAQRSDYLLAIYDGKPEEGTGGTGQVLRWYEEGITDPDFLFANEYFEPASRNPAVVIDPSGVIA